MDEQRPEIVEMFIESEQKFVAQFDPSSDSYHHGDTTPVPLGGERVPVSMPTAYDISGCVRDTPMDPAYYQLIEVRNVLLDFKKLLGQICPAVESVMRAYKFKDPLKKERAVNERRGQIIEVIGKIQAINSQLKMFEEIVPSYDEMLKEVFMRSTEDYFDKQKYADFMQFMTLCSQKVFKDTQNVMQIIKRLN